MRAGIPSDARFIVTPMATDGSAADPSAMDHHLDSRLSQTWRCPACGRFYLLPQHRSQPRACNACGRAHLVRASVNLSFWRLLDD
jgi:hypothetical protein